jgi:cellobiose-specific phosphotransferase system component IIB
MQQAAQEAGKVYEILAQSGAESGNMSADSSFHKPNVLLFESQVTYMKLEVTKKQMQADALFNYFLNIKIMEYKHEQIYQ